MAQYVLRLSIHIVYLHQYSMRIGNLEYECLISDHLASVIVDKSYELCFVSDNEDDTNEHLNFLLLDIKVNRKQSGIDLAEYVYKHYQIPFIFKSICCF